MSKPVKLPEIRKEAFTKAREALGLNTKDLSGMTCLSVRQIEQIENGETSSFYGAQVKVTAAKKVAGILKLTEDDAFDFGEIAPENKSDKKTVSEEPEAKEVQAALFDKAAQPAAPKALEKKSSKPSLYSPELSSSGMGFSKKSSGLGAKKKILFLIIIAAAIAFSVINLRPLFFPEPPKEEEIVIIEEAPQAPASEQKSEAPVPAVVAPEPVTPAPALASAECPSPDASPLNYRTEAPKKPGDTVYLQSKTAQTVCVIDASGKTQNKNLEPGVGVSVFGKPPFKVLTGGLNKVDMYYQGAKVRIGNSSAKTIMLEPVEITIQPAAPVETQIRQ